MRILHRGRHLSPDQKIGEIENLKSGDQLHVVKTEPRRPSDRPRPTVQTGIRLQIPPGEVRTQLQNFVNETRRARPTPYNRERSARTSSNARYNNCAILYRNFEACVQASVLKNADTRESIRKVLDQRIRVTRSVSQVDKKYIFPEIFQKCYL